MMKKVIMYTLSAVSAFALVGVAFAEGHAVNAAWDITGNLTDLAYALIPLSVAIAVAAGTTGQARAAATALEGIARNPNAADKMFVPMLLGLALMESLVLLAWLQIFLIQGPGA